MTGVVIDADKKRPLVGYPASDVLECGDVFVRVQWHHSVIMVRSGNHHRRIQLLLDRVQRRPLDLEVVASLVTVAVFGGPGVADGELVEAEHVGDWHLTDHSCVEVWPLVGAGGDEEATVGTTLDNKVLVIRDSFLLKILSSSYEIIKSRLMFLLDCGFVPILAEFATTSDVGEGVDTIQVIHEEDPRDAKEGCQGNAETTVAVEQGRDRFLRFVVQRWEHTFLANNEHGHLGSILTLVKHLVSHEIRTIGNRIRHNRLIYQLFFKGCRIYPVATTRVSERVERVKHLFVVPRRGDAAHRSNIWKLDFSPVVNLVILLIDSINPHPLLSIL